MFSQEEEEEPVFKRMNPSYFPASTGLSDFKFIRDLASGAFGAVSQFEFKKNNEFYAVKKMQFKGRQHKKLIRQIQRQITLLYKIKNDYIIRLYDHFQDTNSVYLVMEFVDGNNLYNCILKKPQKHLKMSVIARMIHQICQGLQELHSHQIVHRDLKLQNIMLTQESIKIVDLGESNHYGESIVRDTRRGTPTYFCPQILNADQQDDKVDSWCLGVIIYELICLQSPFSSPVEAQRNYKIRKFEYEIPQKIKYEKELIDLLRKIFTWKEDRLNIRQIREHPWMEKYYTDKINLKKKKYDEIFNKGLKYQNLMSEQAGREYRVFLEGQIEKYQQSIKRLNEKNKGILQKIVEVQKKEKGKKKGKKSVKMEESEFKFDDF